jgi:hypothetical protein
MPAMISIQQKAKKCEGLIDTRDVSDWENSFLISVCNKVREGKELTDKQLEKLEDIYDKHFA